MNVPTVEPGRAFRAAICSLAVFLLSSAAYALWGGVTGPAGFTATQLFALVGSAALGFALVYVGHCPDVITADEPPGSRGGGTRDNVITAPTHDAIRISDDSGQRDDASS